MEERVGLWWHRAILRVAERSDPANLVALEEVRRSIALMFRAGGGSPAVRVAPSADGRVGGPRRWLQRMAGGGLRAALPRLDADVLALPPRIAVFDERALNRDLYLWLAALAAVHEPAGEWIADNCRATARALRIFPGLQARYQRLLRAHLARRPALASLRGDARCREAAVRAALGGSEAGSERVDPRSVAPVWLWLYASPEASALEHRRAQDEAGDKGAVQESRTSDLRRHAVRAQAPDARRQMLLFSKVESVMTWSELVRMDRPTEDGDDDAVAAADAIDTLSLVEAGPRTASRVRFDLDLPSAAADDLPLGPGLRTPEWDWRRGVLVADHCALQCVVARPGTSYRPSQALRATARRVRRRIEVLQAAPRWRGGESAGEEIDVDAVVRHRSESADGAPPVQEPRLYKRRLRAERSLATLLLADLSLSTDAYATPSARVIDVIRDALYVFGEALSATGDDFEMIGFSSVRRQHVRIQHLKGFGETWNDAVRARLGALRPGYYTRMGAALRDAARRLGARPERQRLLLLLTDGKPNDLDVYEGRYGLEDTRHAVLECREAGLTPFCVTIDREAHDYLPMLFGQQGYALVRQPQDLVGRLTQVWATLTR